MVEFNRRHGMCALGVVTSREVTVSPLHALVTIRRGAQCEKTGDRLIEFEVSYLMEKARDTWQILSYVSRAIRSKR